jgi:hypothetical protein
MNKQKLLETLRKTEETLLVELLELTSTDIVDKFLDTIEDKLDYLYDQFSETEG